MTSDAGRQWRSSDRLEAYVRDRLVNYPGFFTNFYGTALPSMTATIPGQFNRSGHGVDIWALDRARSLWILEVSRGSLQGAASFKELGLRTDGNAQMSPAWRELKKQKFLELDDADEKLQALLDVSGMPKPQARQLFNAKYEKHKAAVIVPEGCHVQGHNTQLSFAEDIYTFAVSPGIQLHTRR